MGASVKADWYAKTTKEIAEYVGRIYGHDMKMLVLKGQETVPQEPEYPETTNKKDKAIWSKKYDQYLKHEQWYKDYQAKVFTIVTGQCDKLMQNQVETDSEYEAAELGNDLSALSVARLAIKRAIVRRRVIKMKLPMSKSRNPMLAG